jgi:hypothetical protein
MTVAARLGSSPKAADQRTIFAPQNWISGVKLADNSEELSPEKLLVGSSDTISAVIPDEGSVATLTGVFGMFVGGIVVDGTDGIVATVIGRFMAGVVFMANDPSTELIMMTVSGITVKPDKQPLPGSYGDTAVCRVVSVERARGISILFSGSQGPVLEKVYGIV